VPHGPHRDTEQFQRFKDPNQWGARRAI